MVCSVLGRSRTADDPGSYCNFQYILASAWYLKQPAILASPTRKPSSPTMAPPLLDTLGCSLAFDDWFEAWQPSATPKYQPTSIEPHPHPLRSHSRELKRFPEFDRRSEQPDSHVPTYSRTHGALQGTRIVPMAAIDKPYLSRHHDIHQSSVSRYNFSASSSLKDFPIVASRPPLRPSTSLDGQTMDSYSSFTSTEFDKKSSRVTAQEFSDGKPDELSPRGFYACLALLMILNFMGGLNITSLSTGLLVISKDLRAGPFSTLWITIASLLTAALFQPLFMRLSAFGTKTLLFLGLILVTSGSLVAALSNGSTAVILGRSIEGFGNAASRVLTQLIFDQLTAENSRHGCEKWIPAAFWFGAASGPLIGGALAETAGWRYIFYLNVPPVVLGAVTIPFLVRLPVLPESTWQTVKTADLLGWALLSAACTAVVLAFSWAGSVHAWSSWPVLLPLLAGSATLVMWVAYSRRRIHTILPMGSLSRASSLLPGITTVIHGMLFTAIIYMAALYFQSGLLHDPVSSALFLLSWTLPFIIAAVMASLALPNSNIQVMSCLGWVLATVGVALTTVLLRHYSPALAVVIGILTGAPLGLLSSLSRRAIQRSATTDDETINAGPVHSFYSTLGMCLGLTVANCVYLNRRSQGQDVAGSLLYVWIVLTVLSSIALVLSIFSVLRVHKAPGSIALCLRWRSRREFQGEFYISRGFALARGALRFLWPFFLFEYELCGSTRLPSALEMAKQPRRCCVFCLFDTYVAISVGEEQKKRDISDNSYDV
nr:efflux pump fus6 [Quercus suber]